MKWGFGQPRSFIPLDIPLVEDYDTAFNIAYNVTYPFGDAADTGVEIRSEIQAMKSPRLYRGIIVL